MHPGTLYFSPLDLANETRWIPFIKDDPHPGFLRDIPTDLDFPDELRPLTDRWTYTARLENGEGEGADWDWLRGKTILAIGEFECHSSLENTKRSLKFRSGSSREWIQYAYKNHRLSWLYVPP